ncbi:hypothetical protein C3378_28430 [Klebsiella michiganensis]|nr:hypothetical protein C3378_28430 [Klebsiella michiganensis]
MLSVCGFMWISIQAHARCGHDGSKIIRKSVKSGVVSENGIYGHSRFCNTDFDDKLACLNLSGV